MRIKLDPGAFMPVRAHPTDAGLDIRSPFGTVIAPNRSIAIETGVHVQLPPNTCGKIQAKSGLMMHSDILTTGLIDEGYTGQIIVKLFNLGPDAYHINAGDKIAQLVVQPCIYCDVEPVDELEKTERGNNGFGSTGR